MNTRHPQGEVIKSKESGQYSQNSPPKFYSKDRKRAREHTN